MSKILRDDIMTTIMGGSAVIAKLFSAGLILALAGCDLTEHKVIKDIASPDGRLTARVQTHSMGGFGNNWLYTEVALFATEQRKILARRGKPLQILLLNDSNITDADVEVTWKSNKALEITKHPKAEVEFQAVKALGVDISLR